jgi:Flp pilus assembly protein TadD
VTVPPLLKALALLTSGDKAQAQALLAKSANWGVNRGAVEELVASAQDPAVYAPEAAQLLKAMVAMDLGVADVGQKAALAALKNRPTCQLAAALAIRDQATPAVLNTVVGELKPDDCVLRKLVQGKLLADQKQYDQALALFQSAAQAEPGNYDLIMDQAIVLERCGKLEQALPLYLKVWEAAKNPGAANNAAYVLVTLYPKDADKLRQAQALVEEVIKPAPNVAAFHDTLGWIAYLQGRQDVARAELRRAIRGLADSAEAHCHLGVVEEQAGNIELARDHLQAAVGIGERLKAAGTDLAPAAVACVALAQEHLAKLAPASAPATVK